MTLSDRIAIMEQGQFVQIGSPNLIYENPKSKFVADFLGNINLLEATSLNKLTKISLSTVLHG